MFVDDGSSDGTFGALLRAAQGEAWIEVVRHHENLGLGAALRTGFEHTRSPIVCSIDSDCTYPPEKLPELAALVEEGAHIVTASAWHPESAAAEGSSIRLWLSRMVSGTYKLLIGQDVYTFTCLFRAYRTDTVRRLRFRSNGFAAVAEIMLRSILGGQRRSRGAHAPRKSAVRRIEVEGGRRHHGARPTAAPDCVHGWRSAGTCRRQPFGWLKSLVGQKGLPMTMRIGIIGLGRAGSVHLQAWQHVDEAEIVAVCDPSPVARKRARELGIKTFSDPAVMLENAKLDGVTIATPPADHAEVAIACLERGLHVLCEKPLALNTWDALAMLKTASRTKRQLLLATKFRHVPELAAARELINTGKLGTPVAFEVSFCSPVDMSKRWNVNRRRAGGGVIIDNGCHAFDIMSYLFGSVTRVQTNLHRPLQKIAVEDGATIQVRAGDGVVGKADVSWSLSTGRNSYVKVHGSAGTIEVGWQETRVKYIGKDWEKIGGAYDKIDAHRRMQSCFVETAKSDGAVQPWISTVECLRTVAAVEAAYRSTHSGGWEWVDMKGMRQRRGGARATARKRA